MVWSRDVFRQRKFSDPYAPTVLRRCGCALAPEGFEKGEAAEGEWGGEGIGKGAKEGVYGRFLGRKGGEVERWVY